jgi:hypothetical protein
VGRSPLRAGIADKNRASLTAAILSPIRRRPRRSLGRRRGRGD